MFEKELSPDAGIINPLLLTHMIILMSQLSDELMVGFPLKGLGVFNVENELGYMIDILPLEKDGDDALFVLGVRNVELVGNEWMIPGNSIYLKDIGQIFLDYYKEKSNEWIGEDNYFDDVIEQRAFKKLLSIISKPSLGIIRQYGGSDLISINATIPINNSKLFNSGIVIDIDSISVFGSIENFNLLPSHFFLEEPYMDELKNTNNINKNVIILFSNLIESVNNLSNEKIKENSPLRNNFLLILFENEELGTYLYTEYFKSKLNKLGIFMKLFEPIELQKKFPIYFVSDAIINATKKGYELLKKWKISDDVNLFLERPDYIYSLLYGKLMNWLSKVRYYKEISEGEKRLQVIKDSWGKKEKYKLKNREGEIKIVAKPNKRLKNNNLQGIDDYGWGSDSRYTEYLDKLSAKRWVKKDNKWVKIHINNSDDNQS